MQLFTSEAKIDAALKRAVSELDDHTVLSKEYAEVLDRISKLTKLKEAERPSQTVSPDTVVLAITNLFGIYMIIRHEHVNFIASKAIGFVKRL